jgi:HK97 family phage major capsid protein
MPKSHRQRSTKRDLRFRTLQTELLRSNDELKEIEVSFSSETPFERLGIGTEVLSHDPDAVDLSRLNTEGPVLFDHERHRVIGRVMRSWIDGVTRTGRAILRFGKSPLAVETYKNIRDGITRGISVGYTITQIVKRPGGILAVKWIPHEISIAPVPADVSVGVGRSLSNHNHKSANRRITMSQTDQQTAELKLLRRKESLRNIAQTLSRRGITVDESEIERAAKSDTDDATFLRRHLEADAGPQGGADPFILDQRSHGSRNQEFSLTRAIRQLASNRPLDGYEAECSQELERTTGLSAKGILVPTSLFHQRSGHAEGKRTMFAGDFQSAGALVGVDQGPTIEKLDAMPTVERAGATVLRGLSGTLVLPRQTEGATAEWLAESGTVDSSKLKFDDITLTPHRLSTMSVYSKQLLVQTSGDIENLVRRDLALRIALGLDFAALAGSGTGGQPRGIYSLDTDTSGIGTVDFGGAPTWEKIVEFESELGSADALRGNPQFVVSPAVAGKWKGVTKDSGSGRFLMEGGQVNDYRAHMTTVLSETAFANRALFGNFSDLIIGQWGALDLLIDQYTLADQGRVRVVVTQLADVAVRHAASFVVSTDNANQ